MNGIETDWLIEKSKLQSQVLRNEKGNEIFLYYTGTKNKARIRQHEETFKSYKLNRDHSIKLEVEVQPGWYNWYVIE